MPTSVSAAPAVRTRVPYMPDEARAAMPQSPLQPLPAYLLEDFAQSLERERPHELLPQVVGGKVRDPSRCAHLRYRYLDTGETATVPNCWYNQTPAMRQAYWDFEAERTAQTAKQWRERLAYLTERAQQSPSDEQLARDVRMCGYRTRELEAVAEGCAKVRDDVRNGVKFV